MTDLPDVGKDPELAEFEAARENEALLQTVRRLERQLGEAKKRTQQLVAATYEGARDALLVYGPMPLVAAPVTDARTKAPEVALWDLGDWQGAKLSPSYNSTIMRQRVMRYCQSARSITEVQRADHPVREAVVVFGGDMVEGLFNFPTQPHEVDATLFAQYASVSRLLIDVVRFALSIYDKVEVVAEWGNHGRIGSKRDCVPRSDNLDRMCYEFARTMLGDAEGRLTWEDCPEDIQRLEIGNYRALVIHGDEVGRSGYVSPSTMINHVAKWQSGAYPWDFTDLYCHHYHVHQEFSLPSGRGRAFYTGSTESTNRYALYTMASTARPSQRLHFIDPRKGRVTAQYQVWLEDR